MNENVKETLIKLLVSMRDMDTKTYNCSLLIKQIPHKLIPLNVHEFFINEITERKARIDKLEEFSLLIDKLT